MTETQVLDSPVELSTVVEYRAGSVVSRALVTGPSGTVTVFAFDAGEGLSEHAAPFDAVIYAVDGRATVTVGGTPHELAAGQMLRLPATVPHAVAADERFKMLLIMIRER